MGYPRLNEKRIAERLARLDRGPAVEYLAKLYAATPTLKRLRAWADERPEQHARAISGQTKPAGYADRSEAINLHVSADAMAREAVSRFGPERARQALEAMGLPASLVDPHDDSSGKTITVDRAQPEK